nr:hypothetical protein [Haloplanus salinus]
MVTTTALLGLLVAVLVVFAAFGAWYARGRIETVEDYITARNSTGGGGADCDGRRLQHGGVDPV